MPPQPFLATLPNPLFVATSPPPPRLEGAAAEVDVNLERSLQILDPCYISLVSQRTLRLHNRSDIKVQFDWKKLATESQERALRTEKVLQLLAAAGSEEDHRLRQARRAVEEDPLVFEDEIFAIEPLTGEIFPGCSCEVTVIFRPQNAGDNTTTAYCAVNGRQERLQLRLQGLGLGPKATWLYDTLDIQDVFVNSQHKYEVVLENHGEISAEYQLVEPNSVFASKFSFKPTRGRLEPKEQVTIEVRFCSDVLGEFQETFIGQLTGQPAPLPLVLKGRVIGPSFHFSLEQIDFGTVSIGFLNSVSFTLHNTSEVPMRYALRIPGDVANAFAPREFQVVPATGAVLPHGKQKLQMDFISYTVKKYDLSMMVDVEAVGPELLAMPILGECIVPHITTDQPSVDFGEVANSVHSETMPQDCCFLGYAYETSVTIKNTSWLPAKIEIVPQDEASQTIGFFGVEPQTGVIKGHGEIELKLQFTCQRLGPMSLPMYVRIVGMTEPSLTIELEANAVGPNLTLEKSVVDWGKTNVLQNISRPLTLFNDSLIPATFNALTRKPPPSTSFTIPAPTDTLAPGEKRDLELSIYLDDTVKVSEELLVQTKDAEDQKVTLTALGIGSTIWCEQGDLSVLDFGDHYSNRLCSMEITLENRGRKAQTLTWANVSVPPRKAAKPGEKDAPPPPPTIFEITPEKVYMEPRAACVFTVRGLSSQAGQLSESLQCSSTVQGAKAPKVILEPQVTCNFIEPLIEPSMPALEFTYTYEDGVPIADQTAPLTLTNISPLALTLSLGTAQPFSLDQVEAYLEPRQSTTVQVTFHPGFLGDRQSGTHEAKLAITYREHPQKDGVKLVGELCFPNLVFDVAKADLGCALNDTPKTLVFTVHNPSRVEAVYNWCFASQEDTPKVLATPVWPHRPPPPSPARLPSHHGPRTLPLHPSRPSLRAKSGAAGSP